MHIFPSWEDYCEDKHHFHIFLSNLRARVNLYSHDEQSLLVLFKEALQQYRCYLRKSHFDGKSINEFPVKSPVLNLEDIEWKNLVMHWSHSQDEEICSKKNSGLRRTTGYRKYAARCFALNKGNAFEEDSVVNFLNCPPISMDKAFIEHVFTNNSEEDISVEQAQSHHLAQLLALQLPSRANLS
ncbi:uncharacterized protein [Aegilops tauschii subsp. strangulata]|uniref:uncharacterized protein n=1 Tax=Aegilops tauschii subsp. strangulata TaxID=200361 RepID=UPI003CC8A09D